MHKLIVQGERSGSGIVKREKDLAQASALIACLRERRPRAVQDAWADLVGRGPGWAKRAREGLSALEAYSPELGASAWLDPRPKVVSRTRLASTIAVKREAQPVRAKRASRRR
jgi:hypothetical protein